MANFPLESELRLRFKDFMNPFHKGEPKVKVEARAKRVTLDLVLIAGLIVLLLLVVSGL